MMDMDGAKELEAMTAGKYFSYTDRLSNHSLFLARALPSTVRLIGYAKCMSPLLKKIKSP